MKHELLAPAGSIEAGYAALYYGADAVYLGLTKFSARAGALNFTFEELDEFTAFAHAQGKRVFVAINTILNEDEIEDIPETFLGLRKAKVDGLIIQDLGVFYLAKKYLPEVELHASTQMAVHNAEGAKFLYSLGFKRVVLARELRLDEIKAIAKAVPEVDLEVFVHGALCYSYSGECLFSALEYGKSANRGRCIYPCRGIFDDGCDRSHLFSMKDLALEEAVREIPALSLKIEGRKKSPQYVAAVTNYYRHILDGKKKDLTEANDIKQIFSRPWSTFHFYGKDKNVTDREFVGHRGLLIGHVEKVFKNRLIFKTNHKIARYDGLQIDNGDDERPYGFGIKTLFFNNKSVFEIDKGERAEVELLNDHPRIELGAPVYLASSTEVKGKYDYAKPKPKEYQNLLEIDVRVEISAHDVWAMSGVFTAHIEGNFEKANDEKKVEQSVFQAFSKTGGTGFLVKNIEVCNKEGLFVPISLLNELRRQLLENIVVCEEQIVLPQFKAMTPAEKAQKINDDKFIYIGLDIDESLMDNDECLKDKIAVLPQICRDIPKLKKIIEKFIALGGNQFVVENYYGFEVLKAYPQVQIISGSFIYAMNRYAVAELKEIGVKAVVLALENSALNCSKILKGASLPVIQVIKANPPLFTSAVCIRKNNCKDCSGGVKIYNLKKDGRNYKAITKPCFVEVFSLKLYEQTEVAGVSFVYESEKHFI